MNTQEYMQTREFLSREELLADLNYQTQRANAYERIADRLFDIISGINKICDKEII